MKTTREIKERIYTLQRIAGDFFKQSREVEDDKQSRVLFVLANQYEDEAKTLEWVLE